MVFDSTEVGNALAEHFARVSRPDASSPGYQFRMREQQQALDFTAAHVHSYNLPFTEKEFDDAMSSCGDTSPGPDDIPYAMLKNVSSDTKSFILGLLCRIWREHSFPGAWEMGIVLPFVKPGKDSSAPSSYRLIALSPGASSIYSCENRQNVGPPQMKPWCPVNTNRHYWQHESCTFGPWLPLKGPKNLIYLCEIRQISIYLCGGRHLRDLALFEA